jgi:hypothetical protein
MMSVSDAIPSLPTGDRLNGSATTGRKSRRGPAKRVQEARIEHVPMERMLTQLREIIVGPHQRLCEARFEEMIDILSEQQGANESRFEVIESDIDEIKASTNRMEKLFDVFDTRMDKLSDTVDEKNREVHVAYGQAISELRSDFELKMQMIADTMQECLKELELDTRREIVELSSTLVAHVSTEETRWEKERGNSMLTLEQRIAQWRAEIEDDRKQDMDEMATSLMELGQKMIALRGMAKK